MFRKLLFALAAVCLMTGSAVAAETFPNRPITVVVPFAAGGETDLVARMLADGMSKELNQVVVVQNIVGASGVAGISAVTGAKPDGYTLGVTPSAPLVMHPHMRKVPYTLDSFDFVGRILKAPYIVMVAKTPSPATPTPSKPSRATACRSTPPPPDRWISMTSRGWPSWTPHAIRCSPIWPR